MSQHGIDELLKMMWETEEELGDISKAALSMKAGQMSLSRLLVEMQVNSLIEMERRNIRLKQTGRMRAGRLIRSYRITEMFLSQIVGVDEITAARQAGLLEHTIEGKLVEAFCTMLDHPHTDLRGRPIPAGRCCCISQRRRVGS